MGYNLKKQHDATYYNSPDLFGNYQFVSLEDIINQFMIVYVGDEKIINKVNKTDVSFFAQRALAEMSFDTFKSIKSQEITVPNSLTMILPHDYVNYTHLSWVDAAGIKHPIYPTSLTSNPFNPLQDINGNFDFPEQYDLLEGAGLFSDAGFSGSGYNYSLDEWNYNQQRVTPGADWYGWTSDHINLYTTTWSPDTLYNASFIENEKLNFFHAPLIKSGLAVGSFQTVWKKINVSELDEIGIKAFAHTSAAVVGVQTTPSTASGDPVAALSNGTVVSSNPYWTVSSNNAWALDTGEYAGVWSSVVSVPNVGAQTAVTIPATSVYIGVTTTDPADITPTALLYDDHFAQNLGDDEGNFDTSVLDLGYIQWSNGESGTKTNYNINVMDHDEVWVLIVSHAPWEHPNYAFGEAPDTLFVKTFVDSIEIESIYSANNLSPAQGVSGNSSTWDSYSSQTPSENNNQDYEDDTYWPYEGERYGLEPTQAQVNGSFFIDNLRGKINFSSNISGKTVILDYISDSLGTEEEMQVHKFAEEAMYKYIIYNILSGKANIPSSVVNRFKKEKFAATRQAKLRLSNVKLNEITQILRGKSKQIKH